MGAARKITDRQDLTNIHEHGDGFVLYPFGRKLHSARCDTVPSMMLNPKEPRWFAPNAAAAHEYQADRLARYPTAQPLERVQCCASLVPDEAMVGACCDDPPSPPTQEAADSPSRSDSGEGRLWRKRTESASFELWTTRRTSYKTAQCAQQKAMIREIAPLVALLRCDGRERLHGVFVSDETERQPDAENIAFYNFGSAPFAGSGSVIAFERSYGAAPEPPQALDGPARYYHHWSVVPKEAAFKHWIEGDVVATWTDVPLDLEGDLGLAAWRAMRENPERVTVEAALRDSEYYGVDVTLSAPRGRAPSIVKAVKGLVDGPLAGLQRAETVEPDIVLNLLARRWGRHPIDEPTLLRLVTANTPTTLLPRAPFNSNGLDPCDELCVAGIARTITGDGRAVMSGRVFRVQAR